MLNKALALFLVLSFAAAGEHYKGSTTAPVVIAGAVIQATHEPDNFKKYPRKECPVCKGTGKYLSGDGISMNDCGYCEPEKSAYIEAVEEVKKPTPITITPPPKPITKSAPAQKVIVSEPITILPCPTCKPPVIRNFNPTYGR